MNIQKMLKQAQDLQSKMAALQTKLEAEESEGSSGGGAVSVVLTGKGQALKVTIDPKVIDPSDKEMLEDLLVAAINDARAKVDANASQQMGALTSGLQLPPGMKMPF